MNILIRTFNDSINSKTGRLLPPGKKRGTPDWLDFEKILLDCLKELDHKVHIQREHPHEPDDIEHFDKRIYVHKTRRDCPQGNAFYMQMHLKDLFTFNESGWGADAKFPEVILDDISQNNIEEIEQLADDMLISGISKCDQPQETGHTPRQFILVPIQTPRDYTIKHHSPITVRYFIDSISAWAYETKNHVAFKLHPFNKCDTDLIQTVDDSLYTRYCHKVEGNINELIKRSSGVFVINSGTGFEALIQGKPVCTFGDCDYRRVTFNADIRRLDEARNFIYSYNRDCQQLAYKFVYWYMYNYAFYLKDPMMKSRLKERIQQCLT